MAVAKVYNGSSWVVFVPKVHTGSVWSEKPNYWDGAAWEPLYSSTSVELGDKIHFTFVFPAGLCVSNVRVSSDGNYYESNNAGSYSSADEAWLEAGNAADVWMERTITSGTLTTDDVGASRVNLGSGDYDLGVTAGSGTTKSCSFTLDFYDASSGGTLLDSANITTDANGTGS